MQQVLAYYIAHVPVARIILFIVAYPAYVANLVKIIIG